MYFSNQYPFPGGPSAHQDSYMSAPTSMPTTATQSTTSEDYNESSMNSPSPLSPKSPEMLGLDAATELYDSVDENFAAYHYGQAGAFPSIGTVAPSMPVSMGPRNGMYIDGNLPAMGDMMGLGRRSESDEQNYGRWTSDEDAQTKRKAQNRAAQRAFRERKEKHVKDLEASLERLKNSQEKASEENEKLRIDLERMTRENQILKATSSRRQSVNSSADALITGPPMNFSQSSSPRSVVSGHKDKSSPHRATESAGQNLYSAGAAWDYIVAHSLFKRGLIDITGVSRYLQQRASCDGHGPVFSEQDILDAIHRSLADGSDNL
ncbi:unnamed protein product [Clonostachys byssicola]|uniref:BZIP domain-containing protein n=1 Tax=Clonostachys byssicola TaxID=160290 RepID=A0A9N9UVK4_9HYPO|nr:unnamed protein product [Clonostachys byssicola]